MEESKKPVTSFKVKWLQTQFSILRKQFTKEEYSNEELQKYLLDIYAKRRVVKGRFYNNTTNENKVMTIEGFINYYLNNDFLLTGYNVLIKNQHDNVPIAIQALKFILAQRKYFKKIMEASEKGSIEYVFNKVVQLTYKVLANSYYGIMSMSSSLFYNPYIQNSITLTAQDLISTAIYLVESFIGNNEKFYNMDDMISFIENVSEESDYTILPLLDEDKIINKEKIIDYLNEHSDFILSDEDNKLLLRIVNTLTIEDYNKIYYKNQITKIMENSKIKEKFLNAVNENKKDGTFKDENLINLIVQLGVYNHIAWDRFIRISTQKRKASILTDTDSTFIYLGKIVKSLQRELNDESEETTQGILNTLISVLTGALAKTFWLFTGNCNIPEEVRTTINMKNEFIYDRILTTENKKNYAGWLRSELGKVIPGDDPDKHLDMKGLSIRKSTVTKQLRAEFQNLLVDDILLPKKIDILKVVEHYNNISDIVTKSLTDGKTEFLLPKSVDAFDSYKNPESVEQVKASIIWNALEPKDTIVPPQSVFVVKISAPKTDSPAMLKLKETNEDKYNKIIKTVFTVNDGELNLSSNGFCSIAIPQDKEVIPDYIRPMINYDLMVNANIKNANILLKSLGIQCVENKSESTNYKTNIVEWL